MSIAAAIAEPALYSFEDKEYKVHPWTFEIQGKFERYMEKQAMDAYHRVASSLAPEDAEKALASVLRDIANGSYAFGSDNIGKALANPVHVRYLMFLCLKKNHPEGAVDQALVRRMQDKDYRGIIRAMNLANTDPNLREPASGEAPATAPASPSDGSGPAAP